MTTATARTATPSRRAQLPRNITLLSPLFAALALILALTGCATSGSLEEGLPDWTDEQTVTQTAQQVIDAYNARDYDAVAQMCPALGLSAEEYAQSGDGLLDQLGAFTEYADAAFLHGETDGTQYATIVQIANFENGSAQFTVSVNQDGSVSGFYVKAV